MFTSSDTYICLYKCAWTTFVWDLYFFSDKTHAYLVAWLCAFALAVTYEGKMLFLNLKVVYLAFKVILYSEPKPRRLALPTSRLEEYTNITENKACTCSIVS